MSLRIIKDSDVNKISVTLQKYLDDRKLTPKDEAIYRLLNGTKNPDKAKDNTDGVMLYPASQAISLWDTIIDPGDVDTEDETSDTSSIVTIGVIRSVDKEGNIVYKKIHVQARKDDGTFTLRGNNPADVEVYYVLELLNLNASNPHRNTDIVPLFERVDEVAESKAKSKKRNFLFDSWEAIRNWDYDELRVIAAAYNIPTTLDKDILRSKLEEIAEKSPETFYNNIDKEETKVKALISLAKNSNVISYDPQQQKWYFTENKDTIIALERKEGIEPADQLALHLISGTNGPSARARINKLLKANKSK